MVALHHNKIPTAVSSAHLVVNGKIFFLENIAKGDFAHDNDYEQEVLHFCRDWLEGKETFGIHTSGSTGAPKKITLHP